MEGDILELGGDASQNVSLKCVLSRLKCKPVAQVIIRQVGYRSSGKKDNGVVTTG